VLLTTTCYSCDLVVFASQSGWLSAGAPTQVKAAHARPALRAITIKLGSRPQPGEGFVSPSYARGLEQGDYKTPPSGQWMSFDSAGSSDRAYLVWLVSLEGVVVLPAAVIDLSTSLFAACKVDSTGTNTACLTDPTSLRPAHPHAYKCKMLLNRHALSGPKCHTPDVLAQAQAARRAQPVQRVVATAAMAPGEVEGSAGSSHLADSVVNQPVNQPNMTSGA
jgi:hypothetical protein